MLQHRLPAALAAAFCLVPSAVEAAHGQESREERLKIRKIVLYKHGVGYFERAGTVRGSATIPLSFRSAEMKDVLKSLYAVDLAGGRISTILYDSQDPLSKQLEDILFKVPEGSALTQFMMQLKGARVRVTVGPEQVEGTILGIEPFSVRGEHGTRTSHKLVLLRAGGAIQALDLLEAAEVTILDETVRRDLERMMDIHARARYADRKVVRLQAEGEGEREVRAGYIIETPIWKTTYRLLFEEGREPLLQGWAIVENRTDEDWEDVQLSFVAGSPLSFVLDLYTSYYPRRPVLDVGIAAATELRERLQTLNQLSARDRDQVVRGRGRREMVAADEAPEVSARAAPAPTLGELFEMSMEPAAQGVVVGDLFSYEARGPVTIRKGQAALVPILLQRLDQGERVLHYRASFSTYPAHAFRLHNSTSLTLERGPVTFFEGAACVGEGMLGTTLKPGMREFVPYALETAVEVERRGRSDARPVSRSILANGILTLFHTQVMETSWHLRNRSGKAQVLYLDHPRTGGDFRLTAPEKAEEEVPGHYRFRMELPAGDKEEKLVVREEREVSSQVSILGQSADQVRFHLQQPYLSRNARAFLERVAAIMEEKAAVERAMAADREERGRLEGEQNRIRENMRVLRDTPTERAAREQYLQRLVEGGGRIEELDRRLREATQKAQEIQERLAREVNAFRES